MPDDPENPFCLTRVVLSASGHKNQCPIRERPDRVAFSFAPAILGRLLAVGMRGLLGPGVLLAVGWLQAAPIDQWVWRNRLPCSPQFNSLTHGAGLWVASPDQVCLFLATSPDAVHWDAISLNTNTVFSQCAYGNGVFVVAATRGAWVSTNAHNWFHAPGAETFDHLAFGNGWFVGCDSAALKVWRSADGTNWTSSSLFVNPLSCFCFANGKFFQLGGTSSDTLFISTDGLNWSSTLSVGTNFIQKIVYGNGRYLGLNSSPSTGLSEFRVSTDGTNWAAPVRLTNTYVQDAICVSNRFVALDEAGGLLRSSDATNWTEDLHPELYGASRLDYDGRSYVAVGPLGNILSSPDTTNWTLRTVGPMDTLSGLFYLNGTFLATGGNQIESLSRPSTLVTSQDGRTWVRREPGTTNWLCGAAYGNGRYVAVGTNGTIVTSTDSTNWSAVLSPTAALLNAVAYGSGQFVAVGGTATAATLLNSSDGLNWNLQSAPWNTLYGITFAQGQFVAVGQTNSASKLSTILTSPDGLNWTAALAATTNSLRTIVFGNGVYVAAGDRGQMGVSSDGLNWANVSLNTTTSWRGSAYGGGQFLLMQQSTLGWASSANGTNWTLSNSIRNYFPTVAYGVTAGPNSFLVGGYFGYIMESGPFVRPPTQITLGLLPGPVLSLTAPEYHGYEIEATTSLVGSNWVSLGALSNFSATTYLPVSTATNMTSQFYRARSLD